MARIRGLTANQIAKRICNREDNVYNKKVITKQLITDILLMYMDECRKALAEGERIEISKVGSIIPEVKVHIGNFNLPMCNKDGGNPPYTKLKITRNNLLSETMNRNLLSNMNQLQAALMPTMVKMVDELAERVYETLNYFLKLAVEYLRSKGFFVRA